MSPDEELRVMCRPNDDPFDLPDEWQLRAKDQVMEDPQEARKNIETLRDFIQGDKKLKTVRTDDIFLSGFLRARKHNVDKAYKMIKQYFEIRRNYPRYFQTILPSEMKFVYDAKTHSVLHQRDQLGRSILLVKASNFDTKVLNDEKIISVAATSLQLLVEDPQVQVGGVIMILNLADFTLMQQLRLVNPRSAWIMINFLQDSFPMRLRELHIINTPFFFDALYACFAPFLKEKFRKRIKIHGKNLPSLFSCIDPNFIPEDWGGVGPGYNNIAMVSSLVQYEDKIREWRDYGVTT